MSEPESEQETSAFSGRAWRIANAILWVQRILTIAAGVALGGFIAIELPETQGSRWHLLWSVPLGLFVVFGFWLGNVMLRQRVRMIWAGRDPRFWWKQLK